MIEMKEAALTLSLVWFVVLALLGTTLAAPSSPPPPPFTMVSRADWHARPPTLAPQPMATPAPFIVIHHSYQPAACLDRAHCIAAMQWMQDLHQRNNSWNDIGYSFAVGGDGAVYEGRGWQAVGAHAPGYNDKSIGICLIGDWTRTLPPEQQLRTVQQLIDYGIQLGFIQENYQLVGHRQVRAGTECPGDRLYLEITKWKHFVNVPSNAAVILKNLAPL